MKRFIYILLLTLPAMVMHSCINDELDIVQDDTNSDYITLSVVAGGMQTRAVADNELESGVNHLDVVIFEEAGEFKHSERINVSLSPTGIVRLGQKRAGFFDKNAKYFVYVIANSTHPATVFAELEDVDALHALEQVDERIHITGSSVDGAPQQFLMDGAAFLNGDAEPSAPEAIVLYNGVDKEKTDLKVYLRRAAAKVEVELISGKDVKYIKNEHIGYYLRNMPYTTKVIPLANPSENPQPLLRTPDKTTGRYFSWIGNEASNPDTVKVTAYIYSHAWENSELFTRATSLIVNIPLIFEGETYGNSYYQIALRPKTALSFKRNNYYKVTGVINAPGAEEISVPIEISELNYTVRNWEEVPVDANGANAPQFLTVNRDTLKMHNENIDATSLLFSSSSNVTVSLLNNNDNYPYYIDKFGKKQKYNGGGISGTAEGISGNITVNSPIPTNNTIRYFMLEVSNAEGLKDTVWVEQYPLIYITNQQGWYSYRDDFVNSSYSSPTTYTYKGAGIAGISLKTSNGRWAGNYTYNTSASGFWRSKVAYPLENGMSNINYYYWGNNVREPDESRAESSGNARMYHIRVTSTSSDYKVGRPRMTSDGYTDPGEDNKKLVSPSFMIASRLGFINSSTGNISYANTDELKIKLYRNHCANYVEVYKDDNGNSVVLDDWRLPTEAELKIIMDVQGTGNNAEAIDYLLNARYYVSASGPVSNSKSETSGTAGRCVRDAYVK
ncbi:MAG: hypothetical protein E7089_00615 [Bacteroidales bacterium]|nr:hypothetical protein [Bacteroidales bacterium]